MRIECSSYKVLIFATHLPMYSNKTDKNESTTTGILKQDDLKESLTHYIRVFPILY